MTTRDETYHGWSNYETWIVNTWLTDDLEASHALDEIVRAREQVANRAYRVEALVQATFDFPTTGLGADLVGSAPTTRGISLAARHVDQPVSTGALSTPAGSTRLGIAFVGCAFGDSTVRRGYSQNRPYQL